MAHENKCRSPVYSMIQQFPYCKSKTYNHIDIYKVLAKQLSCFKKTFKIQTIILKSKKKIGWVETCTQQVNLNYLFFLIKIRKYHEIWKLPYFVLNQLLHNIYENVENIYQESLQSRLRTIILRHIMSIVIKTILLSCSK